MRKKTILYLVHRTPYPPNRGHRIRSFHWLDFLSRQSVVDLMFLADDAVTDQTLSILQSRCREVFYERIQPVQRFLSAAVFLASGGTATQGAFWSPRFARQVRTRCAKNNYDYILAYCSSMAGYLPLKIVERKSLLVDLVDVDSQKWIDYARASKNHFLRLLYLIEGCRLRQCERVLARDCGRLFVVSEAEKSLFRSFCNEGEVIAVENGVDFDYFRPQGKYPHREQPGLRLTFVGALNYEPNIQGVIWFVREIWPRLKSRGLPAELHVVGARPMRGLKRALDQQAGLFLHADVADVRPYLEGSLAIAPLQIARGVQNKILEAMAMGCPVVATPQAAEGIAAIPGEEIVVASCPEEWVAAITNLYSSPSMRESLGRNARRRIEMDYSWEKKLASLAEILNIS